MRTRNTSTPETTISGRYYTVPLPQGYPQTYSNLFHGRTTAERSSISDVKEPAWIKLPKGRVVRAYKPVTQQQLYISIAGEGMSYSYGYGAAVGVQPWFIHAPSTFTPDKAADLDSLFIGALSHIDLCPLTGHYDRWDQLAKPTMTTRANLAVFLAELREITSTFSFLPQKHFKVQSWREVLTYANNQHLMYAFGWKPFLKDIYNFIESYKTFEARLRKFVNSSMRVLVRHGRRDPEMYSTSWTMGTYPWTTRFTLDATITRASTFQFWYLLPEYSHREFLFRAWADSFGLNPTIANIWAVVPWSFVLDWGVDIGAFLEAHSSDWLEPTIMFLQACSSVKAEGSIRATVTGPPTWGSPSGAIGECKFKHYARAVGAPQHSGWGDANLDADKIRLLASLVGSKFM